MAAAASRGGARSMPTTRAPFCAYKAAISRPLSASVCYLVCTDAPAAVLTCQSLTQ